MRKRVLLPSLALLFFGITPMAFSADGVATKDGRLAHTLIFKDVQGGFAGFTGQLYHIEPNGKWSITRVFNQNVYKPKATGTLTAAQMKTLIASLKKNRMLKLPKEAGSRAQANPHVMTITFGKKKSIIAVRAGLDKPQDLPKDAEFDVARDAFAVRATLRKLIQPKTKKN